MQKPSVYRSGRFCFQDPRASATPLHPTPTPSHCCLLVAGLPSTQHAFQLTLSFSVATSTTGFAQLSSVASESHMEWLGQVLVTYLPSLLLASICISHCQALGHPAASCSVRSPSLSQGPSSSKIIFISPPVVLLLYPFNQLHSNP